MSASLFGTGNSLNVNVNGTLVPQAFTGTGGQTLFTITNFTYIPGTNSLLVFINGTKQQVAVDFTETSTTSFTLIEGVIAGDIVEVIGFPEVNLTAVNSGSVSLGGSFSLQNYLDSEAINVCSYPYLAKGDGSTDDTAAINLALATGKNIYFPRTTSYYKITAALIPVSNQVLFSDERTAKIVCSGSLTNCLSLNGVTRVYLVNLFITYTGTTNSGANGNAVMITGGSSYCTVHNCRLEGVGGGVTIYSCDDNIVEACDITSVGTNGWDIGVYYGGSRNKILNNRCYGGGYAGIDISTGSATSHSDNNIVVGNIVSDHTAYGILIYQAGPPGTALYNIVTNNIVYNISGAYDTVGSRGKGAGIYLAGAEYSTVSDNIIYNTNISTDAESLAPGGIGINGVSTGICTNNIINAANWYGIYVVGSGNGLGTLLIEDNTVSSPKKDGIVVKSTSDVTVSNNGVNNGLGNGIYVTHTTQGKRIKLTENNLSVLATGYGIQIDHIQSPMIASNYCGGALRGLSIDVCAGAVICGNEFRDNTSIDVNIGASNTNQLLFDNNIVRSSGTNGVYDAYGLTYGVNDVAGQTNPFVSVGLDRTLTVSATPSVQGSRMANFGGGANITDLLNPFPGQQITIRATGAVTFKHNTGAASTKLLLSGNVDFVAANNSTLTLEYIPGGPWYEVSRKV